MKRSAWIGVCVILAGLVVGLLVLYAENQKLRNDLDDSRQSLAQAKEKLLASAPAKMAIDSLPPRTVQPSPPVSPAAADPGLAFRKMWADPAFRAARFNDAIVQIEGKYGRFFSKLVGWSPARIEELKRQLANQQIALAQAALPQNFPPSASDQKAMGDAIAAAVEKNKEQLKGFMGEKDFAIFDQAEKSEPYRESVSSIANAMRSKNVPINGDMEESILNAYSDAIHQAAQQAEPVDLPSLSLEQRAALKQKQMADFRALLMSRMSTVLNEQQLNAFLESELEQSGGSP